MVKAVNVEGSPDASSQLMAYFSDWRKLKVAVSWFLKLKGTPTPASRGETGVSCKMGQGNNPLQ